MSRILHFFFLFFGAEMASEKLLAVHLGETERGREQAINMWCQSYGGQV